MTKTLLLSILTILLLLYISKAVCIADSGKIAIHPTFQYCLQTFPRDKPILNPMIPRINASAALQLYTSGEALFVAAGNMAVKMNLIGAVPLTPALKDDPRPLLRFKKKYIVIFCY